MLRGVAEARMKADIMERKFLYYKNISEIQYQSYKNSIPPAGDEPPFPIVSERQ